MTAIDRVRRTIVVTGLNAGVERDEPYDALVLSPGAAPIHPAMPGVELPVIFAVRTIPDSVVIRTWIMQRRPRSAHDLPGAPRPGVLAAAVGAPWATTGSARRIAPALRPDCRAGIAAAAPRTPRRLSLTSRDTSTPPNQLVLPAPPPLPPATTTRQVSLNEEDSQTVRVSTDANGNVVLDCSMGEPFGPRFALLGTVADDAGVPLRWDDPITENPAVGATEVWEMYNFTADAHPIHIHEIQFQVLERQPFGGAVRGPEIWETGRKDTVIAYPGEITRVQGTFDRPGLFVWHCHIVEHEDHEMMRPYRIGP